MNTKLSVLLLTVSTIFSNLANPVYRESIVRELRNKNTSLRDFRHATRAACHLLALKTLKLLDFAATTIATPLAHHESQKINHPQIVLIPVLRSGLALLDPFLDVFNDAQVGFIAAKRDEKTALAKIYYDRLPEMDANTLVIILEPMLATGGTATLVIELLKARGVREENIIFNCIVSAPEGETVLTEKFPDVRLNVVVTDSHLNDKKYIVPGLGDFGDRYFGYSKYEK